MPKPPNSQNGKGPKRVANSKEPRHGNVSGAISINTYPFYILHFTFFTTTPPSLSNAPQPGPPLARSPPQTASTYLSVRYRNHCLRKHGRRRLIYHILRFIDNQRSIGLSLKIHGILTFAENTWVCNGPRSVTEKFRGMRAATRSATQKAGCEGPSNIY